MSVVQEYRDLVCQSCNGDGGWEGAPFTICRETGAREGSWHRCNECFGVGHYFQEVEPITLEDLA